MPQGLQALLSSYYTRTVRMKKVAVYGPVVRQCPNAHTRLPIRHLSVLYYMYRIVSTLIY